MNVIITPQLLKCNKLTWNEKVYTAYFATLQSKGLLKDIRNEDIQKDLGVSKRTLNYNKKLLIDKGIVERKFINGSSQWRQLWVKNDYGY